MEARGKKADESIHDGTSAFGALGLTGAERCGREAPPPRFFCKCSF